MEDLKEYEELFKTQINGWLSDLDADDFVMTFKVHPESNLNTCRLAEDEAYGKILYKIYLLHKPGDVILLRIDSVVCDGDNCEECTEDEKEFSDDSAYNEIIAYLNEFKVDSASGYGALTESVEKEAVDQIADEDDLKRRLSKVGDGFTLECGDASRRLVGDDFLNTKCIVSKNLGKPVVFKLDNTSGILEKIDEYTSKYKDLYVGCWVSELSEDELKKLDDQNFSVGDIVVYVDVNSVLDNEHDAKKLAKENEQKAYFAKGKEVFVDYDDKAEADDADSEAETADIVDSEAEDTIDLSGDDQIDLLIEAIKNEVFDGYEISHKGDIVEIIAYGEDTADKIKELIDIYLGADTYDMAYDESDTVIFDIGKDKELEEASTAFKRSFKQGGEATADYIDGKAIAMVKDKDERDRLIALKKLEKSGKLGDRDSVEKELTRKEGQASVTYEKRADAAVKAGLHEDADGHVCVICGEHYSGYGNNAEPIADGKCCDDCNLKYVIPARFEALRDGKLHEDFSDEQIETIESIDGIKVLKDGDEQAIEYKGIKVPYVEFEKAIEKCKGDDDSDMVDWCLHNKEKVYDILNSVAEFFTVDDKQIEKDSYEGLREKCVNNYKYMVEEAGADTDWAQRSICAMNVVPMSTLSEWLTEDLNK